MKLILDYATGEGRIMIDEYDISKVSLNSVRQQIGIVPQDTFYLRDRLNNIAMNQPNATER